MKFRKSLTGHMRKLRNYRIFFPDKQVSDAYFVLDKFKKDYNNISITKGEASIIINVEYKGDRGCPSETFVHIIGLKKSIITQYCGIVEIKKLEFTNIKDAFKK
jgi:hypothetical protein